MEVTGHSAGGIQDQNKQEQDDASRKEWHRGDRSLAVAETGVASEMVERKEVAASASGSRACRYCMPSTTLMGLLSSRVLGLGRKVKEPVFHRFWATLVPDIWDFDCHKGPEMQLPGGDLFLF